MFWEVVGWVESALICNKGISRISCLADTLFVCVFEDIV